MPILALRLLTALTLLPLTAVAQAPIHPAPAATFLEGAWAGALDAGTVQLHLVFHIARTAHGLTATMDSPDQGARGIPTSSVQLTGETLTIEAAAIHGVFTGTISSDHSTIRGTWQQGGQSFPLVLSHVQNAAALEPKRPQNPTPPFPYRSEDVSYANPQSGNTLAATLTIPPGPGPFPAALLIGGSGAHDRDETVLGHKPFLVLADYLTRHGVEVLRADKRGVGRSTGDLATATLSDFASDAEAGMAFLKTRREANPHRLGILGHSEGAIVASMVAAREPGRVAFVVLMAGPGLPGIDVVAEQVRLIEEASGVPASTAAKNAEKERSLLKLVVGEPNSPALDKKLHDALVADGVPESRISVAISVLTSPGYRDFLSFDPATALRQVKCPVLALDGSKDTQVAPAENLAAIRNALEEGGNRHIDAVELPGLNHLFQAAKTGAPSEYAQIEETIAPVALKKITAWILQQSPLPASTP